MYVLAAAGGRDRSVEQAAESISRSETITLAAIVLAAFSLRVAADTFLPNIHHPDEVFQYLEQGHRLAFGYGVVPWEYREGVRSWLLPGLLGSLMKATAWLGGGVTAYLAVIGAVLSALSLSIVLVAWSWARNLAGPTAGMLAAAITATWFQLMYFASKPLTEAVAASTLFWGAYLLCGATGRSRALALSGGVLLGLTFVLRLHLAPAILVIAVIAWRRFPVAGWLASAFCGAMVVAAAGALDWVTWDYPFQSFGRYYQVNVVEDRSAEYGVSPWYGYVGFYVLHWSGFIVPFAILTLIGARHAPAVLAIPLIIVLSHSLIGHKEFRFVFPALPFVLLLAAIGTVDLLKAAGNTWPRLKRHPLIAATVFWAATSAVLGVGERFRPNLTKNADLIAGFADLRARQSVCGVGLVEVPWHKTGGYAYLHRNLPIYLVEDVEDLRFTRAAFNAALAPSKPEMEMNGYREATCYQHSKVCLYVRMGTCEPLRGRTINQALIQRGD